MYVCSLRTNKWSYDHRQEGAALGQKMSYIRQTAGDRGALKDIQIFGMSSWLRQVHDAVLKLFRDFQLREQRVRLLGDLAEVALTFLRNGAAYGYLLARALYKNGPIIILDEPTAALDPVAEMEVYENFDKIVGDKTAVYISHRLSSCRFCDDIAVFDHGHIVQQGSHDALVEAPGKYQELWHAQAQYYAKQEKEQGVE